MSYLRVHHRAPRQIPTTSLAAPNEKPSNKDAACFSRQSQPEPSNQMSQISQLSEML
jgi:hypothetical protein